MEFDRKGSEEGVEIYSSLQNGKAFLACKIHLKKTAAEEMMDEAVYEKIAEDRGRSWLEISVWDPEERLALCCRHFLNQEELAEGILLHPDLWQGKKNPCLYRIRIALMEGEGYAADILEETFALRELRRMPQKGWFLNNAPFEIRPVAYTLPAPGERKSRLRSELELILRMGANTVCPGGGRIDRELCRICDELGLVVWWTGDPEEEVCKEAGVPCFCGAQDSLYSLYRHCPTARYYYYKACWSEEPFVYVDMDSLCLQPNSSAKVTVYSNQRKVALYVEGELFEFQSEGPVFQFQEIPVKRLPMRLSAEAEECSMSVSAFPDSQKLHKKITFS